MWATDLHPAFIMTSSRLSRRKFLGGVTGLGAAAMGGSLLTGCEHRPQDPPGVTTIEFYNYATPEFLDLYQNKLIVAFERKFPHIKIRMNTSLGDAGYDAKLLTLIAGKMPPDLIHVTQQNFPSYVDKDLLLPVDEFLHTDKELNPQDFYSQVLEGMTYNGQLLGLPADFSTIIMFYNKDLFDKYGVKYPEPDWTWDDYLEKCKALTHDTDKDGYIDIYGTVNPNAYNRWPAWVWMNGGDLFTPDGKICTMDSPAAIEGLKYYVDLSLTHHVAPTPAQSMGQGFEELFVSQAAAMIADSRYAYKKFLKKKGLKFRWDVAPMPRHKKQATTFIWGGNCILKSTKHPKEAWEFLKFLSNEQGAALNLEGGNALPAFRPSAEYAVRNRTDPHAPAHDQYFLDAISYCRTAPFPAQYADYNAAMDALQDGFLGLRPVDEMCRQFTREVNEILNSKAL